MPRHSTTADAAIQAELGLRLRERRIERGLSLTQMARRTGLDWSYIGRIEHGRNNPTLATLLKLAAGLEIDLADLLTGLTPARQDTPSPDRHR